MIRSEPLASFDAPLADRQSIGWAIFADTLFDRPEPTVLSWPCPTCGDHRIKCDCTIEPADDDLTRAECCGVAKVFCVCTVGEDIFGDGK